MEENYENVGNKKIHAHPNKVVYAFLVFGAIALISSIIYESAILAFIGLGLTLWGGLFLFIKPVRYVRADLLNSTVVSSLRAIDKILTELSYSGKGIYLPPGRLNELKEVSLFIPKKSGALMTKFNETVKEKLLINTDGMLIIPTGQALLNVYESKLKTDLSKVNLNYLESELPKLLIEDLELLEDLEISAHEDNVHVKMVDSIYGSLCGQVKNYTDMCSRLGCPLCSSIACALAKVTGKLVVIEKNEFSKDRKIVEIWYKLI
jgi:hypothetical protein